MADDADVRALALGLPYVEEIDCDGFDFRVGGRGFVWSYPEYQPGKPRRIRTDIAVLYVGDEAEKQALLLGEPDLFFTAPEDGGWPLVLVLLAQVGPGRLAELVTDAWRMRAPAVLAAQFGEDDGQSGLSTPSRAAVLARSLCSRWKTAAYPVKPTNSPIAYMPNRPRSPDITVT